MNKGFYFQKVHLDKNTELLISNHQYDLEVQFQWADMKKYYIIQEPDDIINTQLALMSRLVNNIIFYNAPVITILPQKLLFEEH